MKPTILFLLALIPVAALAPLYGFLESCANMFEMLLVPFTTDRTAGGALVIGGPFLVLFIAIGMAVFIVVPLLAALVAAILGGWAFRKGRHRISRRAAWRTIALGASLAMVFTYFGGQSDTIVLGSRPDKRPKTPPFVLASICGANAILSLFVATRILRRMTLPRVPPPLPSAPAVESRS